MLDNIAGMGDDRRNEHLAFQDFHALEELVLVLAPRIGGLEAERPGVDLDYVVDDLRQAYLVEPRNSVRSRSTRGTEVLQTCRYCDRQTRHAEGSFPMIVRM